MRRSKITWKRTVSVLLWLALLSSPVSSQASYTITAEELATLEQSLTRLSEINQTSQVELTELKSELTISVDELTEARKQSEEQRRALSALKEASMKQEALLQTANESLQASAQEAKRTERRLKRQRTIWMFAAGIFAAAAWR